MKSMEFLSEIRKTFISALSDETLLCNMFENIEYSINIYEVNENREFVLIALNKYASENDITFKGNPIGKKLSDLYSGLSLQSINSAFIRAWENKRCEKLTFYLNNNEDSGWRHCLILPLSTGKILNILDDMPDLTKLLKDLYEQEKRLRAAEEESRLSREKLQRFLAYIQNSIEEERARIARDIHDDLGQQLTLVRMGLKGLLYEQLTEEARREQIKNILDMTQNITEILKKISYNIRPSMLDHLGLIPTIEWQAEEFQKYTGIQCDLDISLIDEQIDKNIAISIFRIFQEALSNVANHSNAKSVYIKLYSNQDYLELSIIDNGIGIKEEEVSDPKSFGIIGMNERVKALSGEMDIQGIEGRGTTLKIKIPLNINKRG